MTATDITFSNALADLAERIKVEHRATDIALKESVEHAMKAGDLLLEAKAQVPHGQWLPWLSDRCEISERTAQLYMRIAKNRSTIETQIRNGVADMSINQAVALLMMSGDVRQLLNTAQQISAINDPEKLIAFCNSEGIPAIVDETYNPFHGRSDEEKREWWVFMLFLVEECRLTTLSAFRHFEWVQARPFQNVDEWWGPEGDKFRARCGLKKLSDETKAMWQEFRVRHQATTPEQAEAAMEEWDRKIESGEVEIVNTSRKRRSLLRT
jgi:hypothetical protein